VPSSYSLHLGLLLLGAGSDFQFSIWTDVPHRHFLRSRLYGKLKIESLTLASRWHLDGSFDQDPSSFSIEMLRRLG